MRKDFTRAEKKLIKVMGEGDFDKAYKQGLKVLARRKLLKMIINKRIRNKTFALYIFSKMKFKTNWIVFESFMGRNCSGQPKYIYQYLQKHYPGKYKCIWVVDRRGVKIPGKYKKCKRFGIRYFYYMNRSKYWVINMRQPLSVPKRDDTIILSTWHGTPLKRLVFDMDDVHSATPQYKNIVYRQTREWDYPTVTLEVTPREAEMLVFAEQIKGRLVLSLRNRNDTSYEKELPQVDFAKIRAEIEDLNVQRQTDMGGRR